MIVIGGGLGGLLSAALCRSDEKVLLFEKSRSLGGRFRNFNRDGYALTTGALHMIPHGSSGPLARILGMVGSDCKIIDSDPWGLFMTDGRIKRMRQIRKTLPFSDKVRIAKMLFQMRYLKPPDVTIGDYFDSNFRDKIISKMVRCFLGWSVSSPPSEVSMTDFSHIVKNVYKYGGPGMPIGGCSGVIDSLKTVIKKKDVEVIHERISSIIVEEGSAIGVETKDGQEYYDETLVSNIGSSRTMDLCGRKNIDNGFRKRVDSIRPSGGIKINFSSNESLVGHNGVLFPLDCERVEGINEATSVDSSLAPAGRHLMMSHQTLYGKNIKSEIKKGITDLEEVFPGKDFDVICAQTYFGKNPVNLASQGQDLTPFDFPISNLYLVGDGIKGKGGIEVEGIALGALDLNNKINSP